MNYNNPLLNCQEIFESHFQDNLFGQFLSDFFEKHASAGTTDQQ